MLGVDLVYVPEFKRSLEAGGETFLSRTFLLNELSNQKIEHLAGLFAAKEAVIKAVDLPSGSWLEIEITSDGKPQACVNGKSLVEISISHHGEYAIAIAKEKDGSGLQKFS